MTNQIYTRTAATVAAWDKADAKLDVPLATEADLVAAFAERDAAEQQVIEAWAAEADVYADACTASNIRDTKLPICKHEWRFIREVVLKIGVTA